MRYRISEKAREVLEWGRVIEELDSRCETEPGRKYLALISPLERDAARTQLREVSEIKELSLRGDMLDFSGVSDIAPLLDLAEKGGMLKLAELSSVRRFAFASRRIRAFLKTHREEFQSLSGEYESLHPLDEISTLLGRAITDSDEISQSAYPALGRLRDEITALRGEIERALSELVHSPSVSKYLQEKIFTTRNERYVVLLKANFRGKLRGTVHDVSSSESTLYIEPELITDQNNRLIMLGVALQEEILRILKALTAEVARHAGGLRANLAVIACLDFLNAASRLSVAFDGNEPEIADTPSLRLIGARHPLLSLMSRETVVPNDITLGEEYRCLVISGANTGGKTVLLKTVGLSVLLALHGLHVPAGPDSRIGIFTAIFADIGDDQNLSQSLSTYSGQIVSLREMIEQSDAATLLLIDEIVVGTNPRQGAALAQAIIEGLADTGASMMVTTHYPELKELASVDGRFQNASVAFDTETLAPSYRLLVGIPGASHAIEIARIYGMPERIVSRAEGLLDEREISTEALIEKMHRIEDELAVERERIEEMRASLAGEKERYQKLAKELERREESLKKSEGVAFVEELKRMRAEAAEKMKELQRADMRKAGEIQRDLAAAQELIIERVRGDAAKRLSDDYRAFDAGSADKGDTVFVIPLEKTGKIEEVDASAGSALVVLGNAIKSRYRFSDLLLPRKKPHKKEEPRAPKRKDEDGTGFVPLTVQTSYNTVDLRGMRVDEALERLELSLDKMVRAGIRAAVIIHGHGTGALKEAVRSALRYSTYVRDYRPGEQGEGGDGVTIAILRD